MDDPKELEKRWCEAGRLIMRRDRDVFVALLDVAETWAAAFWKERINKTYRRA